MSYIEAHGTGTELGDPIEINALKSAFAELYQATGDSEVVRSHCGLGSVKTNIGHLELAAGIAGVIKVLLQLKHKTLVKSIHCDEINPYIQLKDSPFYIVQETQGMEAPKRCSRQRPSAPSRREFFWVWRCECACGDRGIHSRGFRDQGSRFRVGEDRSMSDRVVGKK